MELIVPIWSAIVIANVAFMLKKNVVGIIWIVFALIMLILD